MCSCGCELKRIGEDVAEKLESCSRPALLVRLFGEGCPHLLGGRQPQFGQQQRQPGRVEVLVHAATSLHEPTRTS